MVTKTNDRPRMSDAAVKAKTGKDWKQWFAILDKAGAKKMSHKEIVKYLNTEYAVGPWWQQMVTVTYEQQRGLRDKHEKPEGYQVSVSRTVGAPLADLYKAFANPRHRSSWLEDNDLAVRKATANKSMRINWKAGTTTLDILFYAKGEDKSQVVVQHSKLPNASAAAKMKTYWGKVLERLKEAL